MFIYKATNIVNGKMYIGKTVGDLQRRKRQHKHDAINFNDNYIFHKAIRKYGWENFKWKTIEKCNNDEELRLRESYWISYYRTYIGFENCNGYNMTLGGEGQAGRIYSDKSKKKMSKSHLGRKLPKEQREKIGKSNKGRIVTEETKEKIRKAQKGKLRPQTSGDNSPVAKLTSENVILIKQMLMKGYSQRKIAKEFNVSRNTITFIQKGKTWKNVEVEGFIPFDKNQTGSNNVNAKLIENEVREIKKLLLEGNLKQKEIAKKFNVSVDIVSRIKLGKTWKEVEI